MLFGYLKIINIKKALKFTFPKEFSALAKDFIQRILKKKTSERMPLTECIAHAWITSIQIQLKKLFNIFNIIANCGTSHLD